MKVVMLGNDTKEEIEKRLQIVASAGNLSRADGTVTQVFESNNDYEKNFMHIVRDTYRCRYVCTEAGPELPHISVHRSVEHGGRCNPCRAGQRLQRSSFQLRRCSGHAEIRPQDGPVVHRCSTYLP